MSRPTTPTLGSESIAGSSTHAIARRGLALLPEDRGLFFQLTAAENTGWTFDHWEGDLTGTDNTGDLTMDGPKSVTAVFTAVEYTVVVTTSVGAGTNVSVDGATAAAPHQATWQEGVTHSISVPSRLPDASVSPSGEYASDQILSW